MAVRRAAPPGFRAPDGAQEWLCPPLKARIGHIAITPHFHSSEVRLWLSPIAYNLGNLWRRLALQTRLTVAGGGGQEYLCAGRRKVWTLDHTHRNFSVPVYFFIGHLDYNTPFELAERYFDELEAPKKEKVIFENVAHMIPFEEPARFNREVIRVFAPSLPQ